MTLNELKETLESAIADAELALQVAQANLVLFNQQLAAMCQPTKKVK